MKSLRFTKMHGLGNDFMVIDGVHQSVQLTQNSLQAMAKRDTGIGFDQCLIIELSPDPEVDFNYRIFNADGQAVGQCGNGARCLALFAKYYGLTTKNHITMATSTTRMAADILNDHTVRVNMGIPTLQPKDIPFLTTQQAPAYALQLQDATWVTVHAVGLGNPHALVLVPDVQAAQVAQVGRQICTHPQFPEQTNVGFMQVLNPNHIALRVYERGCGETTACGSGAVAAAALGRLYHNLAAEVTVNLPGGDLQVLWPQLDGPIYLTGPAAFVYEGVYTLSP